MIFSIYFKIYIMKIFAIALLASIFLGSAACSDEPAKNEGDKQLPQPVQNSGTEAEKDRATEAVKDSDQTTISLGKDSAGIKTRKGSSVSLDSTGVKVKSKRLKVDVKP